MPELPALTVSIDTEEDNWGDYREPRPTASNILHLPALQEILDRWGARPTYLVSHAPLVDPRTVDVLGDLAARENVEIGGHCHPWNTPPIGPDDHAHTMMCTLSSEQNRVKVNTVTSRIVSELGVRPTTFRSGRWDLGPTVAEAIQAEGYLVDCSVTPYIDWSRSGGPDFSHAPDHVYRFHPGAPLVPAADGPLIQVPATIGFLRGRSETRAMLRSYLERSVLRRFRVVGLLDRLGVIARRWLSPEEASAAEMIRLMEALTDDGAGVLGMNLHSSSLLPGATPFVKSAADRRRFLESINEVLRYAAKKGYRFRTIGEVGATFRLTGAAVDVGPQLSG